LSLGKAAPAPAPEFAIVGGGLVGWSIAYAAFALMAIAAAWLACCALTGLRPGEPRQLLRVSHVFVSHTHMDHFIGLDRLLRICLRRRAEVRCFGPPGFVDQVEHKDRGASHDVFRIRFSAAAA
jgi:ribonuclease BN (tRNA processing enzyme)